MEQVDIIDITLLDNGAIVSEYDDDGAKFSEAVVSDNIKEHIGALIYSYITHGKLQGDSFRLIIKIEEL